MKLSKRLFTGFLGALMLTLPLVGCSSDHGYISNETNPPPQTAPQEYIDTLTGVQRLIYERSLVTDDVPVMDFDGASFGIIIPTDSIDDWRPDEMTADQLSSAIYETVDYVEERLNVKIVYSDKAYDSVRDLTANGDDFYSTVVSSYNKIGQYAMDNLLRD